MINFKQILKLLIKILPLIIVSVLFMTGIIVCSVLITKETPDHLILTHCKLMNKSYQHISYTDQLNGSKCGPTDNYNLIYFVTIDNMNNSYKRVCNANPSEYRCCSEKYNVCDNIKKKYEISGCVQIIEPHLDFYNRMNVSDVFECWTNKFGEIFLFDWITDNGIRFFTVLIIVLTIVWCLFTICYLYCVNKIHKRKRIKKRRILTQKHIPIKLEIKNTH